MFALRKRLPSTKKDPDHCTPRRKQYLRNRTRPPSHAPFPPQIRYRFTVKSALATLSIETTPHTQHPSTCCCLQQKAVSTKRIVAVSAWCLLNFQKFILELQTAFVTRSDVFMCLCSCAKISRSFFDSGHSVILVRTVRDLERKKNVTSNRQSFVSASCKRRDPDHCT